MSYCARCGAYIPQGEDKCLACGYKDTSASRFGGAAAQARPREEYNYKNDSENKNDRYGQNDYRSRENGEDKKVYYGEVVDDNGGVDKRRSSQKGRGGAARRYSSGRTEAEDCEFEGRDAYRDFFDRDVLENKGMAALSYLGILFLIPLLTKKKSPFVRFHLNQGISLFAARILLWVTGALTGWLGGALMALGGIFLFGCSIFGIVNAVGGKRKKLPLIGDFDILK